MSTSLVPASASDLDVLIGLGREFYSIEHLRFDEHVARAALAQLIADQSLGTVCLIDVAGAVAGYIVVAYNFSVEFHGRYAWIDELYLREPFRNQGTGSAVLALVEDMARRQRLAAVRLEVARENPGAGRLYRRTGYEDYNRDLLTKWIR